MHWIDPDSLPEVAGTLERFVLNPHGEVDGFVMNGQTETPILVHTPPHMEGELTRNAKAGDKLRVRGVRPRGADVLAAVAVTGESGRQVIDKGPDHDRRGRRRHRAHPRQRRREAPHPRLPRQHSDRDVQPPRGVLRADGTIILIGPKEAEHLAKLLTPGTKIAVSGDGIETQHGRVVQAKEIGSEMDDLRPIKGPKHQAKPGPKHDHEERT
jgi:hypothetical protein